MAIKNILFIDLKGKGGRHTQRYYFCSFIVQLVTKIRTDLSCSQGPGARNFILIFYMVAEVQVFKPSSAVFPGTLVVSWIGSRTAKI